MSVDDGSLQSTQKIGQTTVFKGDDDPVTFSASVTHVKLQTVLIARLDTFNGNVRIISECHHDQIDGGQQRVNLITGTEYAAPRSLSDDRERSVDR